MTPFWTPFWTPFPSESASKGPRIGPKPGQIPSKEVKIGQFGVFGTPHFGTRSNHILVQVDLVSKGVQNLVPLLYPKMDHPEDLYLEHFWNSYIGVPWDLSQYGVQNVTQKGCQKGVNSTCNHRVPPVDVVISTPKWSLLDHLRRGPERSATSAALESWWVPRSGLGICTTGTQSTGARLPLKRGPKWCQNGVISRPQPCQIP